MSRANKLLRAELKNDILAAAVAAQSEEIGRVVTYQGDKAAFLRVAYAVLADNGIKDISIINTSSPTEVFLIKSDKDKSDGG